MDAGTDLKSRRRIIKELNRPGLGLTLLDKPEGAEVILDFGGRTGHHDEKLIVYVPYPHPHLDTVQAHKQLLIGRGRMFVVEDGKPRERRRRATRGARRSHSRWTRNLRTG